MHMLHFCAFETPFCLLQIAFCFNEVLKCPTCTSPRDFSQ